MNRNADDGYFRLIGDFFLKLLGLDIKATEVYVVYLKQSRKDHLLLLADIITLPQNIFVDGHIKHWHVLLSALKEYVKKHYLKGVSAAISLPYHLTMMQHIKVPIGLTDDDIFAEIHAHLKQSLREVSEPLAIDFTRLPKDQNANQKIHYTAIRQAHLLPYRQCLLECGLHLKIADVDIYALKRIVAHLVNLKSSSMYAALHITQGIATFIIFNDLEILSYDSWDFHNAVDFKQQLQNRMQQGVWQTKEIKQLLLFCPESYAENLKEYVNYLECIKQLRFSPKINVKHFTANANDFLLACGTAMHEVPTW